jgi:hypothetical protein
MSEEKHYVSITRTIQATKFRKTADTVRKTRIYRHRVVKIEFLYVKAHTTQHLPYFVGLAGMGCLMWRNEDSVLSSKI